MMEIMYAKCSRYSGEMHLGICVQSNYQIYRFREITLNRGSRNFEDTSQR